MVNSARGRPPGRSDTRERLLAAGRRLFLTEGYDRTTLRAVAAEAGVDPAMVNYWFGGKEGLLRAVLEVAITPGQVVDAVRAREPEDLATALLTAAVGLWDRPEVAETFRAMILAATPGGAAERVVREYLGHALAPRLEELIGGRDAAARTAAVAACMAGLLMTRYVLRIDPIASMTGPEAVRALAPSLRAALSPPRSTGRPPR